MSILLVPFSSSLRDVCSKVGLAYTAPFRVLSDEGLRVFRDVVHRHEHLTKRTDRAPKVLRGLGYRSPFVRDFSYSNELLNHLSTLAQAPIWPHDHPMNIAHTNFGEIGNNQSVDAWHMDSVEYVTVLILSNQNGMEGGELLVATTSDTGWVLSQIHADTLPADLVDVVKYESAGMAIFMQGSRIAHAVSPLKAGIERRISVVNSYQTLRPFKPDKTVYRTFKAWDGEPFSPANHYLSSYFLF